MNCWDSSSSEVAKELGKRTATSTNRSTRPKKNPAAPLMMNGVSTILVTVVVFQGMSSCRKGAVCRGPSMTPVDTTALIPFTVYAAKSPVSATENTFAATGNYY
jgi:hypothetical protein